MQPQMQASEQKLLTLKGEIRLLEERQTKALSELERLQIVKQKEVPQLQEQIKKLKTEKEQLIIAIEDLKKQYQTFDEELEGAKRGLRFFTEGQIAQINSEIDARSVAVETKEIDMAGREQAVVEMMEALAISEEEVIQTGAELVLKANELREKDENLHEIEAEIDEKVQKSEIKVQLLEKDSVELSDKVGQLKDEQLVLISANGILKEEGKKMLLEMSNAVKQLEVREKSFEAKNSFNIDWEARLAEREEKLRLREEAVTNNVARLRAKGINL